MGCGKAGKGIHLALIQIWNEYITLKEMAFSIAQLGGFCHIWAKMSMYKSWGF